VTKVYDWIKETVKANAGDAKETLHLDYAAYRLDSSLWIVY
jgi:hypothetical protein